jgi:hypothetical protein
MWFTREHFELCNQLKLAGLQPRFETGDVVARGFADLGFEEFQVLPGVNLLSLTAGTVKPLPFEHREHFFWIPSADEAVELIEASTYQIASCVREDMRNWKVILSSDSMPVIEVASPDLHLVLLRSLADIYQRKSLR